MSTDAEQGWFVLEDPYGSQEAIGFGHAGFEIPEEPTKALNRCQLDVGDSDIHELLVELVGQVEVGPELTRSGVRGMIRTCGWPSVG